MGIKQMAIGRKDVFIMRAQDLVAEPGFNVREEGPELDEYIRELADYIYSNDADKIATLITSNLGRPLKPLETATVLKRMHDLGLTNTEIAQRVGKSLGYVGQLLALITSPQEVINEVKTGKKSASGVMRVNKMKEIREIMSEWVDGIFTDNEAIHAIADILGAKYGGN